MEPKRKHRADVAVASGSTSKANGRGTQKRKWKQSPQLSSLSPVYPQLGSGMERCPSSPSPSDAVQSIAGDGMDQSICYVRSVATILPLSRNDCGTQDVRDIESSPQECSSGSGNEIYAKCPGRIRTADLLLMLPGRRKRVPHSKRMKLIAKNFKEIDEHEICFVDER